MTILVQTQNAIDLINSTIADLKAALATVPQNATVSAGEAEAMLEQFVALTNRVEINSALELAQNERRIIAAERLARENAARESAREAKAATIAEMRVAGLLATEKQIAFLRKLGYNYRIPEDMTKKEASAEIDALVKERDARFARRQARMA